jgi:hypothetical protein
MRRLFSSFAVTVQVSDEYVTTSLIVVICIFILVFFFRNLDFIRLALAWYALFPFAILSYIYNYISGTNVRVVIDVVSVME